MEMILTDKLRINLGLDLIDPSWEKVEHKGAIPVVCYYGENNVIKKVIQCYTTPYGYNYIEYDAEVATNNREKLLPKTAKGKEKPVTGVTLQDFNSEKTYFSINQCLEKDVEEYKQKNLSYVTIRWTINKQKLHLEDALPQLKDAHTMDDACSMLDAYLSKQSNHQQELQKLKNYVKPKTKPVRVRPGDFFAVAEKHDLYGNPTEYVFGRHLLNISKMRKEGKIVNKEHHWNNLMSIVQLVTLYDYSSPSLDQDLTKLKTHKRLPAFHMTYDEIMRGHYPIVGYLPLEAAELDFPMHYGKMLNHKDDRFYFGWGMIQIVGLPTLDIDDDGGYTYRNNGVGFGAHTDLLQRFHRGEPPYYAYTDICHPDNKVVKEKIFDALKIPSDIDYDDFCRKQSCLTKAELLEYAESLEKKRK